MFEKILFPTDFSTHAQAELDCLTSFPDIREIVLVTIVKKYPIPLAKTMIEKMMSSTVEGYLEEAKQHLKRLNPAITVTLDTMVSADIAGTILEIAAKHQVDLIIISGYIRNFKAGVLLGRVPATVLCRISRMKVLVMPNPLIDTLAGETYTRFCTNIFSCILCPTDFSVGSLEAITGAAATQGVKEIILLHVLPEKHDTRTRRTAEERLLALRDIIAKPKIRVRTLVTAGDIAAEIAEVAEHEKISLIWMSSANKGCFVEFLSGNLVHDVMMKAKRPTLIFR